MRIILIVCFMLSFFQGIAQTPLESITKLKQVLSTNPSDSVKIKSYGDLCWYYRKVNTDSAFAYGNKALKLSVSNGNLTGEAQAYNDIGILYYDASKYDKALNHYQKSLRIRTELKDTSGIAALYNKIGLVHQNTFRLDSAMHFATKALAIYTSQNNMGYAAVMKNNIANLQKGLKQYKQALTSHLEIAQINKDLKDSIALTRSYNNIANAYLHLKDTVNGVLYYKKGIVLAKSKNYIKELAALYNNYAGLLENQNKKEEAIDLTLKSLDIRKQLNDKDGIASASLHLAGLFLDDRATNKAKPYLYTGLNLSEEINANELKINAYDKLTLYHAFKNNIDSLIYYKELFKTSRDSVFSKWVVEEVAEIQEKYNKTEREKEILFQRTKIAENELDLNRKNTQLIGLSLSVILLGILGYLLYNQQKLKNRQLQKESELKEALIKIETQNKLQEQRLRISRDLHDNIGAQLTFIISSIENLQYGFKITNIKLNEKLLNISAFTKETILDLRDTIWAMNKQDISIEDLKLRILNFVEQAKTHSKDINFKCVIDSNLSEDVSFTSVTGMNIYRIIQEAINNAIKYAEASTIEVSVLKLENDIHIEIKDDGKGFNLDSVKRNNGLNNIEQRAESIGASLDINSKKGKGTRIKLILV